MNEAEAWYTYELDASKITQGTILYVSGVSNLSQKFYVVLNPECDLEHGNAEYLNIAGQGDVRRALEDILSDFSNLDDDHWAGLKELASGQIPKIIRKIIDNLNGRHGPRWFFIPSDERRDSIPLLVFDLQQIYTVDSAVIPELLTKRRAILRSPYREALVTRLYSYLTRVGTDDAYKESLCLSILESGGFKLPERALRVGAIEPAVQPPSSDSSNKEK